MKREWVYVVYDKITGLPLGVFESRFCAQIFIGCGRTTFWGLEHKDAYYAKRYAKLYEVERVEIPTDEEIDNWFLTNVQNSGIIEDEQTLGCVATPQLYKNT